MLTASHSSKRILVLTYKMEGGDVHLSENGSASFATEPTESSFLGGSVEGCIALFPLKLNAEPNRLACRWLPLKSGWISNSSNLLFKSSATLM